MVLRFGVYLEGFRVLSATGLRVFLEGLRGMDHLGGSPFSRVLIAGFRV